MTANYKDIYIFNPQDHKLMQKIYNLAESKNTIIESINLNTFVFTNKTLKFVITMGERIGITENNELVKVGFHELLPQNLIRNAGNPVKIIE